MEKGLFSSNVSIFKIIIKKYMSNEITSLFRNITTPKNIQKYEKDIEKLGFNTANIYFSFQIKNVLFIVQKFLFLLLSPQTSTAPFFPSSPVRSCLPSALSSEIPLRHPAQEL